MILWTLQKYEAYESLLKNGKLISNYDLSMAADCYEFDYAYKWMINQMNIKLNIENTNCPIWLWYQYDGIKNKKPDMRRTAHDTKGTKLVRLTLNIDENKVLLSDFSLFHFVLNYWYLPINEEDGCTFDKIYDTINYIDMRYDFVKHPNNLDIINIRNKIENSWQRIFDLSLEDDYLYYKKSEKSIQATTFDISLEDVIKVEEFIAK